MERLTRHLIAWRRFYLSGLAILAGVSLHFTSCLQYEQSVGYLFRTDKVVEAVNADSTVMILIGLRQELSRQQVEQLQLFEQNLEALDAIASVTSILDVRRPFRVGRLLLPVYPFEIESDERLTEANQLAAQHSLINNQLISSNGRWMRVLVELSAQGSEVFEIEKTLAPIAELCEHSLESFDAEVYITGLPPLQLAIAQSLQRDQLLFIVIGALAGWLMAMSIFRNWRTVVVVVSGPVLGLVLTFGLMGFCGEPINPINVVLAPLALTIALADAVHLQLEIDRQRRLGASRESAILESMRRVGPACVLTAITTAIGFGALITAEMLTIRELGVLGGVTVVLALGSVLVLVPLLSSGFFGNVSLPSVNRPLAAGRQAERCFGLLLRHSKLLVLAGLVAIVFFAARARELQPDISISEALPTSSRAREALEIADASFGGTSPISLVLSWQGAVAGGWPSLLAATRDLEAAIEREDLLAQPLSILDLLKSLPKQGVPLAKRVNEMRYLPAEATGGFINTKRRESYIHTSMPDAGSQALTPVLERLQQAIAKTRQSHPQFKIQLDDANVIHLHLADSLIISLLRAIVSSVVLCCMVIAVGTRSLLLGVVSLLPNMLVLAGTAGVMHLARLPLQLTSMTVFTIAYGIGVDDTIHLLRQFQLTEGKSVEERVLEALRVIAVPITLTTLILVAGLSGVLFSEIPSLFRFGALFIAALLWALLGDLMLLPAALICVAKFLGRKQSLAAAAAPPEQL